MIDRLSIETAFSGRHGKSKARKNEKGNEQMKTKMWDNGNKMHFESEFKTFNKQTNLIATGNVYANTQTSSYIRPFCEVDNFGYIGKPGEFMRFDLRPFRCIPEHIRKMLEDVNRKESYILYEFFVRDNGCKDVIGYVLSDYNNNLITSCVICGYGRSYWKRDSVIRECINYICN